MRVSNKDLNIDFNSTYDLKEWTVLAVSDLLDWMPEITRFMINKDTPPFKNLNITVVNNINTSYSFQPSLNSI